MPMETARQATLNADARRILARVLSIVLTVVLLESASYAWLRLAGWYDSWSYVTISDPDLWIALRPRIHAKLRGIDIVINRSGLRDSSTESIVAAKRDGEFLVVALGDSNMFGNLVPFERLITTRLEAILGARSTRRVRVVNLAVPSHSTVQSKAMLARWLHLRPDVVIIADSLNDRGFATRADSAVLESGVFQSERPYELGRYIIHSVCLAKLLTAMPFRQPPLDGPLPAARVPLDEYRKTLEDIAEMTRGANAKLVFLATGDDPEIAPLARHGLDDVAHGRFREAGSEFGELARKRPTWFLPWYYGYLVSREGGGDRDPASILREYEASGAALAYLTRFVRFAFEYDDVMHDVAARHAVPMIDMTGIFEERHIAFRDVCHFSAEGHDLVAEAIARELAEPAGR